jgi:hypothetical protein
MPRQCVLLYVRNWQNTRYPSVRCRSIFVGGVIPFANLARLYVLGKL